MTSSTCCYSDYRRECCSAWFGLHTPFGISWLRSKPLSTVAALYERRISLIRCNFRNPSSAMGCQDMVRIAIAFLMLFFSAWLHTQNHPPRVEIGGVLSTAK